MEKKIDTTVRFSPLDIPKIVKAHWNAKPKEPAHFIGEPSTVKSEGVKQEAKRLAESIKVKGIDGVERPLKFFEWNRASLEDKKSVVTNPGEVFIFADLRASETDIGELRLQDMKNGENFITFKYNILFEALSQPNATGILFFDEMNLAPNMIKAQFYKIINDRAVGDIPISDGVLCLSAGNEAEHSRGVTEDPVPLVLRRGNYFLNPLTAEEYTDYAAEVGQHKYIIGYLGFKPGDVHKILYDLPDSVGQPCPRSWTKMSNLLINNPKLDVEDIKMLATGVVGQGVATMFAAYVKSAKDIDLDAIIKNPKLIKQHENDEDLSILYAIISGVVDRFRTDKKVLQPAFEIALELERPEFGAYLLRNMKATDKTAFMKAGSNDKAMDQSVIQRAVERYAKFIFKG